MRPVIHIEDLTKTFSVGNTLLKKSGIGALVVNISSEAGSIGKCWNR